MSGFSRSNAIAKQSFFDTVSTEADSLRNQAENAGLLGISKGADRFFIPEGDEQVHHVSGLRMLDPVFDNTTDEQAKVLQQMCPTGHSLMNFALMKANVHQGERGADSIHNWMRQQGLEVSGHMKPGTFIEKLESVRNAPFEQKVAVMQEYCDVVHPMIKAKIDDLLNESLNPLYNQQLAGVTAMDSLMNIG